MHSKYYLKILEDFHKKLCELQQLEDELENNVQKWHWAGHVQKTRIVLFTDLCKQNFIKAVDERPLGLQRDFGPSHLIKQSMDVAYLLAAAISIWIATAVDEIKEYDRYFIVGR